VTVIAEFSAPISEFPLGVALTEAGLDRVEFERVVPVEGDPLPLFWVWGDDVASFVTAATAQPAVASVSLVSEVDDGALCRADWDESSSGVVSAVQEAGLTVLDSTGVGDRWRLRVRATDRTKIGTFIGACETAGLTVELTRLSTEAGADDYDGLTDGQREVLLLAFERGYFEEPRRTSLDELADELRVSRQAAGARLRRAHANLVEYALLTD
jgi:predicted DNA binding protein